MERPGPTVNPVGVKPLIALTGATGFIGQCLLRELPKRGYRLRVLLRRPSTVPMEAASAVVGDLARPQNMAAALADVDAVIHSAGVAHAMSGLPEDDYRVLNTEATIALARAAQRAGARRFIFLSSIRAQSGPAADHVLTEDLPPQPTDAYGRSKLAAEEGLAQLDLDWVALRLVLVYGAGVKGNMAELLRFARAPYPLPLGALRGRRSLLALDNLVAAIDTVLAAPGRLRQHDRRPRSGHDLGIHPVGSPRHGQSLCRYVHHSQSLLRHAPATDYWQAWAARKRVSIFQIGPADSNRLAMRCTSAIR